MNLFDFHWNVQAAARAGLIPDIGHSYVWLVDAIVDVLDKLDITKCFPPNLRGWQRTWTKEKHLTTCGVQWGELGVIDDQICNLRKFGSSTSTRLVRSLLQQDTIGQLAHSDEALDAVVRGDVAQLSRVFQIVTTVRNCEELVKHAGDRARAFTAFKERGLPEVQARVRTEGESSQEHISARVPVPATDRGAPQPVPFHMHMDTGSSTHTLIAPRDEHVPEELMADTPEEQEVRNRYPPYQAEPFLWRSCLCAGGHPSEAKTS
jgi:hypothetical protein